MSLGPARLLKRRGIRHLVTVSTNVTGISSPSALRQFVTSSLLVYGLHRREIRAGENVRFSLEHSYFSLSISTPSLVPHPIDHAPLGLSCVPDNTLNRLIQLHIHHYLYSLTANIVP